MKKLLFGILALSLVSMLHAEKGKLMVSADQQGAYVDGKKKAMIGEGFDTILLEEGEYKVKVAKSIDANYKYTHYEYTKIKAYFPDEENFTKISFKLKRKITAQGRIVEQTKKDRWKRSGNIVTDKELGLEWQDNDKAKTTKKNWSSAKKYCKNLTFSSHSDWRLPSYDELLT